VVQVDALDPRLHLLQLIAHNTACDLVREKAVGLDIPENVKTFVGFWHLVCQLAKTLVNKTVALRDIC